MRAYQFIIESNNRYSVKTDTGEEFPCKDKDHAVNKARSLLSYKKADKVYILQNGKAVYSWQLGSKLEPMAEGIMQNAVVAALVAALSLPAKADLNTQPQISPAAQALGIIRKINKMKDYGQAGFEAEAQQEFSNIMRSIQGHPNQSKIYPIIKDIIQNQEQELPPLQEPVNERKKKKKRSKRGYPVGGYYGYYWGGTNYNDSDAGGDAGGGGDGGGESVYEDDSWPKVDGGYEHSGLGYKRDRETGNYPVYPLPRWNIYSKYSRNEKGTSMDILHYMTFLQNSYQTASMDISGDEIATTIAKMYDKNPKQELQRLNSSQGLDFNSWHDVYRVLKKRHQDEMIKALKPKSLDESEARLDPKVEEFLDGLTPDDVGYDEVGDYIVHYEGFTDQCQDTEEYQANPQAVFDQVWSDFRKRAGKDPINYGIVGEHDYPIVYSVFRK